MEKVTGLGGVFIKANDPLGLSQWYEENLGIAFEGQTYVSFKWDNNNGSIPAYSVFSFFKEDTKYFDPSSKPSMINFRVKDLERLIRCLKENRIETVGELVEEEYGKFAWIMDPEGNKIELWEPGEDVKI
jgi:lactoylglutathione lyase